MLDNIIHVLIAILNLVCFGYLIHVIGGLIKYRKNVFEHRNKALSIIILVLTIFQVSKKQQEELQSFNVKPLNSSNIKISIEDNWFSDLNVISYNSKQHQPRIATLSHTGLIMGIEYQAISINFTINLNQEYIKVQYFKNYRIYGNTIYRSLKSSTMLIK